MDGWTETCRDIASPWECDVTEHFTIAYYFDRLADAASTISESLGLRDVSRSVGRRFDVRFARELRAGASFHILSGAIALSESSVRLGHRVVDSADGEVTAWAEETLDIAAASLPREIHDAVSRRLLRWEGPLVERRRQSAHASFSIEAFLVPPCAMNFAAFLPDRRHNAKCRFRPIGLKSRQIAAIRPS